MARATAFLIAIFTVGMMSGTGTAQAACLGSHGGKASPPAGDCAAAQTQPPAPAADQLATAESGAALAGFHQVGFEGASTSHRYVCTPSGFGQMATCN